MATLNITLLAAAAASVLALAAPAAAQERTIEVRVNDLDLGRPSAQEQLQDRIDRAVRKVCARPSARNSGERQDVAVCETKARSGAEAQADDRISDHKADRSRTASKRAAE